MGRKRLLTILAAVTAAITLQVGPAAAANDCLVLGEDVSLLQLASLSSTTCVVDAAGELIQGTLKDPAGTTEKVVEETVETVEKTTKKVTDAVTGSGGTTTPAPEEPKEQPKQEPKPAGSSGSGGGASSTESSTSGGSSSRDVAASGDVREPRAADPAREHHIGILRGIRDDLAAGSPADRGIAGPVQPFGDLATTDDLAEPQVADAGDVAAGVPEGRSPQIAPAPQSQEAVLATSSPMRDIAEAPLALQLLAAALVMGAATVWTIASRELGRGQSTTA